MALYHALSWINPEYVRSAGRVAGRVGRGAASFVTGGLSESVFPPESTLSQGGMEPDAEEAADALVALAAEEGLSIRITEGYRSPERQAELYAQGRTAPGPRVTNAKPGRSIHQHGRAFDVAISERGVPPYDNAALDFVGMLGEEMGLKWGGRFRGLVDRPHFEVPR